MTSEEAFKAMVNGDTVYRIMDCAEDDSEWCWKISAKKLTHVGTMTCILGGLPEEMVNLAFLFVTAQDAVKAIEAQLKMW